MIAIREVLECEYLDLLYVVMREFLLGSLGFWGKG